MDSQLRSQKGGGVEFINFPNGYFRSEYALSSPGPGLLESGVKYERPKIDREIGPELKNREISFLTQNHGRMTSPYD